MKIMKFEGTPEEFKAVSYLFADSPSNGAGEADVSIEPKEAIKKMLTRIPVSNGQLKVYQVLYEGEIEYTDFLIRANRSASEIAGVFGALGRRINNTKEIHQAGLPGNIGAVISERMEGGKRYLSLHIYAKEALEELNLV